MGKNSMSNIKQTLTTECISRITQMILAGELLPGDKIKGEYLKNRLQTGLSPIREALSRLAGGMLVEVCDNSGFRVARLDEKSVCDGFETYAKVEALLLKEAIEHGDDAWEAEIMGYLYRLAKVEARDVKVPYKKWAQLNDEFHDALIGGCHLAGLKRMRQECLLFKDWCYGLAYPNLEEELVVVNHDEHVKIAELACSRKADAASLMVYKHTLHSLAAINLRLKRRKIYSEII